MSEQHSSSVPIFWAPAAPLLTTYRIEVQIDTGRKVVAGTERLMLTNGLSVPLHKLVLQSGQGGRCGLHIRSSSHELCPITQSVEADRGGPLLLDLCEPLEPGGSMELAIDFQGPLPAVQYGTWMLRDWYPRLWWGYPTCDDFKVRIQAPEDCRLVASGRAGRDPSLWQAQRVQSFGIVVARDCELAEAWAGDTLVRSLFTVAGRGCAELLLEAAVDAIDFYRSEFGFYPQPFLSIVPGMEQPAGGFPFATGIVSIHGQGRMNERSRDFWKWIIAHEIGHQYWGEHVLEADSPGWLWIALGIFMDREYTRARGLDRTIHRQFIERYLDAVREGIDTTLDRPPERLAQIQFDYNNIVIHGKGFAIISALESVLGRATFRRVYESCLLEFAGRRLGAHQFQKVCEEETGQDLDWFFRPWIRSNAYLAYRIAAVENTKQQDRHLAKVRIERLGTLAMPVPVEARFQDGSVQRGIVDRILPTAELFFESTSPLVEAVLDPDAVLPLLEALPKPTSQEVQRELADLGWTGVGDKARQVFLRAQECGLGVAGQWVKLGLVLYDGAYYLEALEAFQRAGNLSEDTTYRVVSWVWQGHLLDLLERREEALESYQKARETRFTGSVQHDQYGIVLDARWIEERLQRPFTRVNA
jgi:Peptidase family M1 domain